jgi:hypothetical protein
VLPVGVHGDNDVSSRDANSAAESGPIASVDQMAHDDQVTTVPGAQFLQRCLSLIPGTIIDGDDFKRDSFLSQS